MSATALSRPATTRASSALLVSGLRKTLGDICLIALTFSALGLLVPSLAKTVEALSGLSDLVMLVAAFIVALKIFRWR